ncbi:hypothetical protein K435DRAFT_801073 [Dendrothele bispora CBS 962.96]|uniref:NADP-dependent oxidoreductase domain-containing protein n=1 Tax=Dendrothele bispora (strain CBS 962.96) TaxID=1314807 RepID=A0A4S8LR51_DENBC|nr:hypothetical protein K435DRAFT_801073 [Dendrothele bispora CBS 962.96]
MNATKVDRTSALPVILGVMTFGFEGKSRVRVHNPKEVEKIIDVFCAHSHAEGPLCDIQVERITHNYKGMQKHILLSLKALNTDCLHLWYLHAPDRTVSYKKTMNAVNYLHKKEYFKRFGISNFASHLQIFLQTRLTGILCTKESIMTSTVRQTPIRKFGISLYAFNPRELKIEA